ncbi:protein late bloomer [Stomoxys calcitrans]|uniref:Tetraspanin n=1 Tax=Stomoxys calcitrans TaxID=35570 RepID=A0A1I8NXV8_STOCA|nr:protein late bloomer [Stomoxys calcitrans]
MACSTKTLKFFAIKWDVIYAILSIGLIVLGSFILFKIGRFDTLGYSLVGMGSVVLLTSIIGIAGAAREKNKVLRFFAIIVIALAIAHAIILGFFWVFKSSFLVKADKAFDEVWREQPTPIKPDNGSHIASIERWFGCCGNSGAQDYHLPPHSCYDSKTDKLNLEGCRDKIVDFISDSWTCLNIFILIFVVIELMCAIFSFVLANSILNRWRRAQYYPK